MWPLGNKGRLPMTQMGYGHREDVAVPISALSTPVKYS